MSVGRSVLESIVEQDEQELFQAILISLDSDWLKWIEDKRLTFGKLARGDWESQFVSMHSDDMLFVQPFFFNLFSTANFTADLTVHVALIPVIMFGLILAHVMLIRLQGLSKPLSNQKEK